MLDQTELRKYFNQDQIADMFDLHLLCEETPPGRIRRARIRKVDPNHIPRPVNSFMTYRSEKQALIRKFCPTANHREISKMLAKWWHNISSSEKNLFVERAKTAKQAHSEKYPEYTFRPKTRRELVKKSLNDKKMIDANKSKQLHVDNHHHPSHRPNETLPKNSKNNNTSNNMYADKVLFNANNAMEDDSNHLNFWNPLYQSNPSTMTQDISDQFYFPSLTNTFPDMMQNPYADNMFNYHPSPIDNAQINDSNSASSSMTMPQLAYPAMVSNSLYTHQGYGTPLLENEITPLSQAMSTPRLCNPDTPLTLMTAIPQEVKQENGCNPDTSLTMMTAMTQEVKQENFEDICTKETIVPSQLLLNIQPSTDFNTFLLSNCGYWGTSVDNQI